MRRKQPKTFHHFWAVDNTISDLAKLDPLPPPQRENLKKKKKIETDFTRHFHTLDFTFHHAMLSVLSVTRADCRTRFESSKHSIEEEEEKKNCRYRFSQTRKAAQS